MWRLRVVFLGFLVISVAISARLFYWQIIAGGSLREAAANQYFYEFNIPAIRGQIMASDNRPLVMNQIAYLAYAMPQKIEDATKFSQTVAPLLSMDVQDVVSKITVPDRVWVLLKHKVDEQTKQQILSVGGESVGFENESKRYYPEGSMAAQLLGFVGSDQNGFDKGYFGLEGFYDRELRGKDGKLQIEHDVAGVPILLGGIKRIAAEDGRNLILWLDRTVQYIVDKRLREGMDKYGAKEGSVVVMDPATGGILAMSSFPGYDPAQFGDFGHELYKNAVVAGSYEPGSTFKTLVMSAALEDGVITPSTLFDESGPVGVGQYFIRTWNNEYHGPMTMTKVLEHSSNVGMVFIEKKLGKDAFLSYIHAFGFGQNTGIDLEDEATPELRRDNEWKEIDLATASFGQGIAVTPIQMVRAVGALANGGILLEPHMVKEIKEPSGKTISIEPKKTRQVISPASARLITEMMIESVDKGEAKWAKPKGYRIAGKTGTAQIPVAGHYDDKKTIASFVGFAPADKPKFVMLVTLREPSSSPWGSETAAPLFFKIASDLFTYYGIPPR